MGHSLRNRRPRHARPAPEALEGRRLPAALAPLPDLSVPSQQGYEVPLDGSHGSGPILDQTFTITRTSGSADLTASIAQGPFWTINVSYTDPSNPSNTFTGALVFQLFQQLTPNTVREIQTFMKDGYFTGKEFIRIANGFPNATDYILQGGTTQANEEGASNEPGTPFLNENVQQLAFTGTYQLAMANAGINPNLSDYTQGVNTNDNQFFITTGSPNQVLGYGYTIFGQMIAGQDVIAKMTQIPLIKDPVLSTSTQPSITRPANPLVMSSLSLATTNPSGVAIIDTSQAHPGDTATFQVTATDSNGATMSRSFTITAGTYSTGSLLPLSDPPITFKPLANAGTATVAEGNPAAITATGQAGYPNRNLAGTLSYTIVAQPSHGTVTPQTSSTGAFTYTPDGGYSGPDSFQYEVQETGETPYLGTNPSTGQYIFLPATSATSSPATVSITVTPTPVAPAINWPAPAAITYGTALSSTQLDATAGVPGTFVYSPPAGTVLKAGTDTLSATFTPTDTAHYKTVTATTTIDVARAVPTITWPDPAAITSGTALSALQLDAAASVPGTFTYSPAAGAVLGVGNGQTLSVTFTPADSTDYEKRSATATINVLAPPPPPPLVTVTGVADVTNKKHQVTKIVVTFSGPLDAAGAASAATYQLIKQGKRGKFTATPSSLIGIASASYDPSSDQVTLIPLKPFALTKPVEVLIEGGPPSGLHDAEGRLIDGSRDGQPGGNAAGLLSKRGASVTALRSASPSVVIDAVDLLVAQSSADGLVHTRAAWLNAREKGRRS